MNVFLKTLSLFLPSSTFTEHNLYIHYALVRPTLSVYLMLENKLEVDYVSDYDYQFISFFRK
jgi:hypothetical protein